MTTGATDYLARRFSPKRRLQRVAEFKGVETTRSGDAHS
jgi:hypothetical protein